MITKYWHCEKQRALASNSYKGVHGAEIQACAGDMIKLFSGLNKTIT